MAQKPKSKTLTLSWSFRVLKRLGIFKRVQIEMLMNRNQCVQLINELNQGSLWRITSDRSNDPAVIIVRKIEYIKGSQEENALIVCRLQSKGDHTLLTLESAPSKAIFNAALGLAALFVIFAIMTWMITWPNFVFGSMIEILVSLDTIRCVGVLFLILLLILAFISYVTAY